MLPQGQQTLRGYQTAIKVSTHLLSKTTHIHPGLCYGEFEAGGVDVGEELDQGVCGGGGEGVGGVWGDRIGGEGRRNKGRREVDGYYWKHGKIV